MIDGRLACCIITDDQKRVLLLHRDTSQSKQWEIPGGKIEDGEDASRAAAREVMEELGAEVAIQGVLGAKEFQWDGRTLHCTWFAVWALGRLFINEPQTFDGLGYFSLEEMREKYDLLSPNAQNFLVATERGEVSL